MVLLITTLSLAIAATNPAGESEYNSDLNLNLGEKHYIGAAAAGSEGSIYFKPGVAINNVKDVTIEGVGKLEFDSSTSLNLGFGFHIAENIRLEVGYYETENDIKNSVAVTGDPWSLDQETISVMALFDFATYSVWTPYIGVGVAISDAKLTAPGQTTTSEDDSTVCFCAGIDWALGDSVDLYAEYRTSESTFAHELGIVPSSSDVRNNTVMIGINWRF
jgi:opacity protein-like surface antigen